MSWRKWFGMEEEPKKPVERTPQTIQVGDAVSYDEENYLVEQRIEYHGDGGDVWWDILLVSPKGKYWLGVVEDEGLELTMYREIPFHPDMPPDTKVSYDGEEYAREEYGFADAVVTKSNRAVNRGRVEYWDYESETGKQLCIERWGLNEVREDQSQMTGTVKCSLGEIIKPYQISIFPGDPEE